MEVTPQWRTHKRTDLSRRSEPGVLPIVNTYSMSLASKVDARRTRYHLFALGLASCRSLLANVSNASVAFHRDLIFVGGLSVRRAILIRCAGLPALIVARWS